jgi:hypothetical protein
VEDGGAALSWRSGLSFKREGQFSSDLALGRIFSDLPWAEGALWGGLGKFYFGAPRFGLEFSCGFFQHDRVSGTAAYFSVHNDGGQGFFVAIAAPLHIGEWSIVPSFLYGSGSWADGSLYWFFGKPGIPVIAGYGLSLRHTRHELALRHLSMDMDVLANDGEGLFDSHWEGYAAYYRLSLDFLNLHPEGTLGWLYAGAGADGALTASNQHFAYFPYNFYSVLGSLGVHAGFGAVSLKQTFSSFQYRIMVGAAHSFQGEALADIHYKKKALYDGKEGFDALSLDIRGIGAAFVLLDAGFPALRLGKQTKAALGLKKLFVLPWGYEKILPGASAAPAGASDISTDLWKTLLLSGLSLYGSLSW